MPHQCIRCGLEYPDGDGALLKGCKCGAKFFFFYKEKLPEKFMNISKEERKEVFKDVQEIIGKHKDDSPVVLDLENIRVSKPGIFELDLLSLFRRNPVIYKYGEGKYIIDLESTFQMMKRK